MNFFRAVLCFLLLIIPRRMGYLRQSVFSGLWVSFRLLQGRVVPAAEPVSVLEGVGQVPVLWRLVRKWPVLQYWVILPVCRQQKPVSAQQRSMLPMARLPKPLAQLLLWERIPAFPQRGGDPEFFCRLFFLFRIASRCVSGTIRQWTVIAEQARKFLF